MKKKTKFYQWIANLALSVTKFNVNTACIFYIHQPKLPEGAKKLRKF
ncbi:MAG TPA: cyclic lactone autoinducer peptide [Firmicutes bacterium]|nr:cyclic lactone autoinducer peptide [Bacillota bacterium]